MRPRCQGEPAVAIRAPADTRRGEAIAPVIPPIAGSDYAERVRLRGIGPVIVAIWGSACAPADLYLHSSEGYVAVLSLSERGAVLSRLERYGPIEVAERIELAPNATEVVVLRLDGAAIAAAASDFDRARAAELSLVLSPSCPAGLAPGGQSRDIALPSALQVEQLSPPNRTLLSAQLGDVPALNGALLRVPIASERCSAASQHRLEPFAAQRQAFGAQATIGGLPWRAAEGAQNRALGSLVGVVPLDANHLVVASQWALALLERGQDYGGRAVPSILLPTITASSSEDMIQAIALARAPATGPRRLYVVGRTRTGGGFLWRAEVDAQGLRWVGTATIVSIGLDDVTLDEHGDLLAVGGSGRPATVAGIFARLETSTERLSVIVRNGEGYNRIIPTGLAAQPALIGSDAGGVYLGDPLSELSRFALDPFSLDSIEGLAFDPGPGGADVWASARNGPVFEKRPFESSFDQVRFEVPSLLHACGRGPDACGRVSDFGSTMTRMLLVDAKNGERYIFSSLLSCTGVLAIRLSDRCISAIPESDHPTFETSGTHAYKAVARFGDELFYVGEEGAVGVLGL